MPLVVPRDVIFVFSNGFAWRAVHDHDLSAVGIGAGTEMDVVEMGRVLVVEEDTAVAMVSSVFCTADTEGDDEVAELDVLDQSDVIRAANLGLIVVFSRVDSEDVVLLNLAVGPALLVGGFPAFETFFEVFTEDEWEFGLGVIGKERGDRQRCECQEEGKFAFHGSKGSGCLLPVAYNVTTIASLAF